jgi:uncharacterized membrane protein YjjB (DUF3815 family)
MTVPAPSGFPPHASAVAGAKRIVRRCKKTPPFSCLSAAFLPMFVPSLSWYNDGVFIAKVASQKRDDAFSYLADANQ